MVGGHSDSLVFGAGLISHQRWAGRAYPVPRSGGQADVSHAASAVRHRLALHVMHVECIDLWRSGTAGERHSRICTGGMTACSSAYAEGCHR